MLLPLDAAAGGCFAATALLTALCRNQWLQERLADDGPPTPEQLQAEKAALQFESILVVLGHLHALVKNLWAFKVRQGLTWLTGVAWVMLALLPVALLSHGGSVVGPQAAPGATTSGIKGAPGATERPTLVLAQLHDRENARPITCLLLSHAVPCDPCRGWGDRAAPGRCGCQA